MTGGPVLFTERLILRLPEAQDLDAWAAMHEDEETMRFIGGAKPRSQAWRDLCAMRGAWDIRGAAMFSVIERASGRWMGRIGPWAPDGWPGTEVGWGLAREFAGRGYACEAAAACMDYAADVLGWREIIHLIDPANRRSIALAERLGSTKLRAARMPAPYDDVEVDAWGQTADQWRARAR